MLRAVLAHLSLWREMVDEMFDVMAVAQGVGRLLDLAIVIVSERDTVDIQSRQASIPHSILCRG